jgi:hypothetical protein
MEHNVWSGSLARTLQRLVAASAAIGIAAVIIPGMASAQSDQDEAIAVGPPEQGAAGNYDYNGDGLDDIVARRNPSGNLEIWPGNGSEGFGTPYVAGTGWGAMDLIETAGDLNEDGWADLIAREASTGTLYYYRGNGTGFNARLSIGIGWQVMSAIVAGHDYNGDGHDDILATEIGTGTLWLYPGTGTGTAFGKRFEVGSSFHQVKELTAVGDLNEDGHADIVGVSIFDECMYFYGGPGSQKFKPKVLFDCGWDIMESAAAVGDFSGDGHLDWVGKDPTHNHLYLFRGDGTGRYSASPVIDWGWNTMTIA